MYICMYIVSFSIKCIYQSLRLASLSRLLMRVCMRAFRHPPILVSISLCILHVRDKWPFPRDSGSLSSPSLHTLVIWLFPWLDLSGLVIIHFLSIYLFLSWYFIRLAYIVFCSYQFTFHVQYFPHIILIHPINSLIFFISSHSSLIYSSWILSSSLIYSYWTSSNPWFMRLSAHITFYTRGYGVLSLGLLSLVFLDFFIVHCVW